MRFIQFNRPDTGELALPFFSDRSKAEFAAGGNVGIIAMEGRTLFELTLGASLMLNPNNDWLMLYPPEIRAILSGEPLAGISKEVIATDEQVLFIPPTSSTKNIMDVFATHLATEPDAEAAYLVEIVRGKDLTDRSILVTIIAPKTSEGRIVQTSSHALQQRSAATSIPVLISVAQSPHPSTLKHGIQIYARDR